MSGTSVPLSALALCDTPHTTGAHRLPPDVRPALLPVRARAAAGADGRGGRHPRSLGARVPGLDRHRRRLHAAQARRPCASCTGTPTPPSGPTSSAASAARRSSIRTAAATTDDFGPGDVWYFPRGYGHSIQGLGPDECHFILIFDNGDFSEYRHLQHHRLAGADAGGGAAPRTWASQRRVRRQLPEARGLHRPGPDAGRRLAALSRAAGSRAHQLTHRYPLLAQEPRRSPGGGDQRHGHGRRVPDLDDDGRRRCSSSSRAPCASCTGTPTPTSGSTSSRARRR